VLHIPSRATETTRSKSLQSVGSSIVSFIVVNVT
jgi:hypothetical protein